MRRPFAYRLSGIARGGFLTATISFRLTRLSRLRRETMRSGVFEEAPIAGSTTTDPTGFYGRPFPALPGRNRPALRSTCRII